MNIDIRKNIIENFKESTVEEMQEAVSSGIDSKEEMILPGFGVFFEILYASSTEEERKNILEKIKENL